MRRGECARSVRLFRAPQDLQAEKESKATSGWQGQLGLLDPKATTGREVSEDQPAHRAPLVPPAPPGPQDRLATPGSCRGWGREERMGSEGPQDPQDQRGQAGLQDIRDPKVFEDRKETLGL